MGRDRAARLAASAVVRHVHASACVTRRGMFARGAGHTAADTPVIASGPPRVVMAPGLNASVLVGSGPEVRFPPGESLLGGGMSAHATATAPEAGATGRPVDGDAAMIDGVYTYAA